MRRVGRLYYIGVLGLALLGTACGGGSGSASAPTSTQATSAASATGSTATPPSGAAGASFCHDAATANAQLLTWTTATPGSAAAAAEPLASAFQTLAGEAPAAVKAQLEDLAATFVQLEKYDTVTDPNTLLQEGPLTNGHVGPDSNALGLYTAAHC